MASSTASWLSSVLGVVVLLVPHVIAYLTPVISTESGQVQGLILRSASGRPFNSFVGIPYGQPPIGELRFKPPRAAESWARILPAMDPTIACSQPNLITKKPIGQEDCLRINVYTPMLPTSDTNPGLPVLVFIHGGAFFTGTGSFLIYRPHRYMDHDVVLVTFNYRLGLLGFLDTEDELSTGNFGLHDQVLALKWVQKNIKSFGGDPDKVTIFGESAGSASVLYHMISPLSKGLFGSAISQSGSAMNHWAFQREGLATARRASAAINCKSTNTSEELFECFKNSSATDLALATASLHSGILPLPAFSPTYNVHDNFLLDEPRQLIKAGKIISKVPMIMGIMENEGYALFIDVKPTMKTKGQNYIDNQFCTHLSWTYAIESNMTKVCDKIAKRFFEGGDVESEEVFERGLVKALGDAGISSAVVKTIDYLVEAGVPVQAFVLSHRTEFPAIPELGGVPGKYASHADELTIQFDFNPQSIPVNRNDIRQLNPDDRQVNDIMSNVWIQLASNQKNQVEYEITNGNLSWPLYDVVNRQYVELKTQPEVKPGLLKDEMVFWEEQVPQWIQESRSP